MQHATCMIIYFNIKQNIIIIIMYNYYKINYTETTYNNNKLNYKMCYALLHYVIACLSCYSFTERITRIGI